MTRTLEIRDLAAAAATQLSYIAGASPQTAPPAPFALPLDADDYAEIGWYFNDYLLAPLGQSKERAEAVTTGLRNLGRLLFEKILRANEGAAACYSSAAGAGLAETELIIVSERPEFLALPWELLNEPEKGYLTPQLAGVTRRGAAQIPASACQVSADQFNALLLAPAPEPDAASGLAPETIAALESLKVTAELDYLRPASLSALRERLAQRIGYYHLAQLDNIRLSADGDLLLEGYAGIPDAAPAKQVADLLAQAKIPVVLLSFSHGSPTAQAAAIAQFMSSGAPCVVALPYSLGAEARKQFAQEFYPALVQGKDVAAAVNQARRVLMNNPQRNTAAGKLVAWDWLTPAVYQSQTFQSPAIREIPGVFAALMAPGEQLEQNQPQTDLPRGGPYGLVGRRAEIAQLERWLQESPAVLLHGGAGVGKTELALGFAAWQQKTGGYLGGVFYTTFEVGAGLERVIHEIGTTIGGLDFADWGQEQRRQWVADYLRQYPCLLVWDQAERASGFPSGAPGLLDAEELADLNAFLNEVLEGGVSRALLTSRRPSEAWLTAPHTAHELAGLSPRDAQAFTATLLDALKIEASRVAPEYVALMETLHCNPLALQLALPLLKQVPAALALAEVKRMLEQLPVASHEEGRDPALTAVMEYAFGKLPARQRTHLPFLSLFQRRVMQDIVTHITQEKTYRAVMGEELGWGACRTLLRSCREAGFLEPVTPSVYQIHPAFPWFLGRKLRRQANAGGLRQLEQEFTRVYADTADYFMEQLYENQNAGATAILAEEANLTQALALAMEANQWDNAQLLTQPIAQVYRMQKRYPELRRLRRQLLQATGQTAAGALAKGAAELWLYLTVTEANEAVDRLELDLAESLNQQALDYLTAQPNHETDPRLAAIYHQFGVIALRRGRLAEAEQWLGRSLAIIEKGDDPAAVADDYHALGQVMLRQRRYTDAKDWFRRALDIHQRAEDVEELVKDYRALGLAAQYKFEYDEALSWHNRAREALEEHRDEDGVIPIYHDIGTVCLARYQYEEAENWFKRALMLADRLGKTRQMAIEMHHLGLMEQTRQLFYDDAEDWYSQALEKWEELGDRRSYGDECRQLGVLFHEQKQFDKAAEWYQRARDIFEELGDVNRLARAYGQLGMVAEARGNPDEALEWVARAYRLAEDYNLSAVTQAKAHLARLRDLVGQEAFTRWWRGALGSDPPAGLDVDTSMIL